MKNKPEYWACYIGPTTRDQLPMGADLPMRIAVQTAFERIVGKEPNICSSGWGVDSDQTCELSFATHDEELKRDIISSYINESIKMPPHVHAWKLYFDMVDKKKKRKRKS